MQAFIKKNRRVLAAAMLGVAALSAPTSADARNCRDTSIEVVNRSGGPIQVYDIDYFDYSPGRWRSEPVRNRIIGNGQSWVFERNLEGVGNEQTYMRVEYRVERNGRFRGRYDAYSETGSCYRGAAFRVVVR